MQIRPVYHNGSQPDRTRLCVQVRPGMETETETGGPVRASIAARTAPEWTQTGWPGHTASQVWVQVPCGAGPAWLPPWLVLHNSGSDPGPPWGASLPDFNVHWASSYFIVFKIVFKKHYFWGIYFRFISYLTIIRLVFTSGIINSLVKLWIW